MDDRFELNMDEYLPLRDVVFNTLRQAILKGKLEPGERLMEVHLANELGVSRTPIREAIRKLELEGLVVMVPRRGAEVAQITIKNLNDVLEVRRDLDALSARLACERITPEAKDELKKACDEFARSTKSSDITIIATADVNFHDIILRATGNISLKQVIDNLSEQIYRYRFEYLKDTENYGKLITEHEEICQAILTGDTERASNLAKLHIENQEKAIIRQLDLVKDEVK